MLVTLTARPDGDDVEVVYLNPLPEGISTNYESFSGALYSHEPAGTVNVRCQTSSPAS